MNHFDSKIFKALISNDRGVALVTSLLILAVLSLLGTAAVMTTSTDVKISGNFKNFQEVFYASDGGSQDGLNWLYNNHDMAYHPLNDPNAPNGPAVVDATDSTNFGYGTANLLTNGISYEYRVVSLDPGVNLPTGYTAIPPTKQSSGFSAKKTSAYSGSSGINSYYYQIDAIGTGQSGTRDAIRVIATYNSQN